jgi:hypothetical protein
MKNVIFKDKTLNGWEYGMLRSFEKAIHQETNALEIDIPQYMVAQKYMNHFGHGLNRGKYRSFFPKQTWLPEEADVAWYVLMGPENYRLDLFKGWSNRYKKKILYLYDTLPAQYNTIQRIVNNADWDILITSFNEAVDDLEKLTLRKWYCVEQASDAELFKPVPTEDRLIHFSSYGRRYSKLHNAIIEFCDSNKLYYDYTTHDAKHPTAEPAELYKQYAWHLSHSLFTFSWPVELTNPSRAGHLSPITCRWFEALASGTAILGQEPRNKKFIDYFGKDFVVFVDPELEKNEIFKKLDNIYSNYHQILEEKAQLAKKIADKNTWNERVKIIQTY